MYLQLDTQFNPFTYDEMVKPLLYYKQAYDEAEAAYSDLVAQTEAWKDIANRENSPEAFEMYQRYSGDLSRAVDDFSQGMTAKNRRALIGLRRRYAQDIAPIARASEAMNAANAFRANAGPDAIFEVGEYNSLDQFLHGQTANNRYQSRDALTKRTAAITEAAMAEALRDPEFQKAMGDQYYMITQHTGGSYEDLTEAMKVGIMDNPIANNRFSEIRQQVARSAGISNYDAAGQQAIMDAIDTGLYAGLDKPVRNFQANQDHITPAQNRQLSLAEEELKLKKYQVAAASAASNSVAGRASRLGVIDRPFFFDIKNPNKSRWADNEETGVGTPINYQLLSDSEDDPFNKIVQDKTGFTKTTGEDGVVTTTGYGTLKQVIDAKFRTIYPNVSDDVLEYIIQNHYVIQVDEDNGNIWITPNKVITGIGDGPTSSNVDTNVAPV